MALGDSKIEIKEYLQKNLEISLAKDDPDYDGDLKVWVEIVLEGEVISKDYIFINKGDFE